MTALLPNMRKARLAAGIPLFAALMAPLPLHAQTWPSGPVRIVVDSAAGSANDATGRILADKLGRLWNQQVVIVNQPGAGGSLAARAASTSANDGSTLFLPATSSFLVVPGQSSASNIPIELPRDFESIGFVLQQPIFLAASPASGITSVPQLLEMARQKPDQVAYAATGRGRLTHLTMELLQSRTNTVFQFVPYAGGPAQAMNDVISGRVPLVLDAYAGLAGAIQSGAIKGLASSSDKRLPNMPDLPTFAETVPDFFVGAWNVLLAPKGTPAAIVRKVAADLRVALADDEVIRRFAANGAFVRPMAPEEVTAFVQSEQRTWAPILQKVALESAKSK